MHGWREMSMAEMVRFRNGKSTKGITEGNVPVYGSNGIIGTSAESLYSNAIILGRVGAYCGSVAYCPSSFWATDNTIVAEPIADVLDVVFAYYLFLAADLNRYAGGAAQPLLTQTNLKGVSFSLPPLKTQRRIARILGAYDDLIQVNQRRIAVLEEMARGLFTEWFIRLRFPGHENVATEDTPNGPLPAGWNWGTLGDVCQVIRSGSTPSRKLSEYWDNGILNWFTTGELNDGFLFSSKEQVSSKALGDGKVRMFPAGTVFIALYGATIGKLGISRNDCCSNQAALGIVPDGERMGRWQLFHALQNLRDWFVSIGQGAAQQNISKEKVAGAPIMLPPRTIAENFHRIVSPIWELRAIVEEQAIGLSTARDLLLPRLISGHLSVTQAERELEAVA